VVELSTMVATVLTVREPRTAPPPRESRDLAGAVANTARSVLSHHSFLWLLGSRIFFLVALSLVTRLALFYMEDSIGLTPEEAALAVVVAGGLILISNGLAAYPSAVLSDRFGRKAMIYVACAIGVVGMLPLVVAQRNPALVLASVAGHDLPATVIFPLAGLAVVLVGSAAGTFYAVDWALVTDIIPKDTTARYMGISNVVNAMASPLALVIGGIVITIVNTASFGQGPRAAFALAALFYVAAALLLRPVDPRRWEDVHGGPADSMPPEILSAGRP
jgi:MFS family permease